jgi:HlyD family secretion protein
VPAGALFRQGDRWAAFVVADGRAHLRIVKTDRSSGTETHVIQGLKAGDEVILYPGSRVRDGQRVRPMKISLAAPAAEPAPKAGEIPAPPAPGR